MKKSFFLGLLSLCLIGTASEVVYSQYLFWVDADFISPKLGKADLSGDNVSTVSLITKSMPQGLALDAVHNKLYFGELTYANAKIRSAIPNLTGITTVDSNESVIRGVVVDAVGSKMYWTTSNLATGAKIIRANVDGTSLQTLYSFTPASGTNLRGIALQDTTLYWADFNSGKIRTGTVTGSVTPADFVTGLSGPVGVAIGTDNFLYWTEANSNTIKRRSLSSATIQTIVSGLSTPNYIAIEPTSAKMYWTEIGVPKIKKADLAGTNVQTLAITVTHPTGIVATSSPLPVQLASFTFAVVNGTSVRLNWMTISETNNYGFYVERRPATEQTFETLPSSFVAGHGTTLEPHQYSFTDNSAPRASLLYRLKQVDLDGATHFSDAIVVNLLTAVKEEVPLKFELQQNYPNPFNPRTIINYQLPIDNYVTLKVFDMMGREVTTLVNGIQDAGFKSVEFNAEGFASGVYFYRLESAGKASVKRLLLLR